MELNENGVSLIKKLIESSLKSMDAKSSDYSNENTQNLDRVEKTFDEKSLEGITSDLDKEPLVDFGDFNLDGIKFEDYLPNGDNILAMIPGISSFFKF